MQFLDGPHRCKVIVTFFVGLADVRADFATFVYFKHFLKSAIFQ